MADIDINLSYKLAKIIYKSNNGVITAWKPTSTLNVPNLPVPDFAFKPEHPGDMVLTFLIVNEGPKKALAPNPRQRTTYIRPMDLHFHFPPSTIQVDYFNRPVAKTEIKEAIPEHQEKQRRTR